ncbi:MAG: hypothetical protein ACT4P9_13685 [Betaproteobacteria bacterium]
MKRILSLFIAVLAALLASCTSWASDKHGGQEVQAGKYHVELVVKDRGLTVYVRDEADKPIDVKSVKVTASLFSGRDKATITFAAGAGSLSGQAPFSVAKDAKILVTFSIAGGKSEQARFQLGAKQDHKGHKH